MKKYKHVRIRFGSSSKTYWYRVPSKMKVSAGQFVVVLTQEGKKLVQVREVDLNYVENPNITYKTVYGIVNLVEEA